MGRSGTNIFLSSVCQAKHFTERETESERLNEVPRVIQVVAEQDSHHVCLIPKVCVLPTNHVDSFSSPSKLSGL